MDDKDVMEACVPKIRSISQEPSAARGVRIEANCGAWRRVGGLQVIRFLGFPYGGSRRTSMYLVLVGEASICTNLKGEAQIAWVVIWDSGKTATVNHGSCVMLWGSDLKTSRGTMDLCYACMNLLYYVEMFVWCQEQSLALIPC